MKSDKQTSIAGRTKAAYSDEAQRIIVDEIKSAKNAGREDVTAHYILIGLRENGFEIQKLGVIL